MGYNGCSFTGHRIIEAGAVTRLTNLLDRAIAYVYDRGCRDFYNGGAIGFDILAARRVILFKMSHPDVRLHMILPCRNQTERWGASDVSAYEHILYSADTVEYLSDEYYDGCMRQRNERLVSLCDVLVAYVGRTSGGSAQTFRMAKGQGKEVFNLFAAANGS